MRVKSFESRVNSRKPIVALRSYSGSRLSTLDSRLALTLVELLVVVVILTTIVAAAIPILAPTNDERRLREATRALNTYITGAQSRAISLDRPYGIALKRLSQDTDTDGNPNNPHEDNGVSLEVFYVEQPLPYAGFDANSRARLALYAPPNLNWYAGLPRPLVLIQFVTRGASVGMNQDSLPVGWDPDLFPQGMVRPGDVIEIQGSQYRLIYDPSDTQVQARFTDETNTYFASNTGKAGNNRAAQIVALPINNTGQLKLANVEYDYEGLELGAANAVSGPFFTLAIPYKILRQAAPTSDDPYQLPEGTAIDLRASGFGLSDYFYVPGENDNSQGVIIMFAPEGRVARLSYSQMPITNGESPQFDDAIVDNVFLLVGKRENIPAPPVGTDPTLRTGTGGVPDPATQGADQVVQEMKEPINWLNGNSRWIVIGSQSGRIATVENATVDPWTVLTDTKSRIPADESTEEMRTRQILAAREFTREMSQMGGR
jgi:type II secretory pathway pseudopilin PulG